MAGMLPKNKKLKKEMVNNPDHYNYGIFEVADVQEMADSGVFDGAALKYLLRWKQKHTDPKMMLEDLDKAAWYAARARDQFADKIGEPRKFSSFLKRKLYTVFTPE